MNTCATCLHWRKIRDENYKQWPGPHGECKAVSDTSESVAWVWGEEGTGGEDVSLITQPSFGCTLWTGKESK